MKKRFLNIGKILLVVVAIVALGVSTMILWNWLMPSIVLSLIVISIIQVVWLCALGRIFFGEGWMEKLILE